MTGSPFSRPLFRIAALFSLALLWACGGEMERFEGKPNSIGKANQILLLADEELWETNLGDTLDYYYESPFPILPRPEPNFNLKHHTYKDLIVEPALKELRTIFVVANLSNEGSEVARMVKEDLGEETIRAALEEREFGLKTGRDKWAGNQLLIYLFANTHDALVRGAVLSYPALSQRIRNFDALQIEATVYIEGENKVLMNELRDKWNINIRIPNSFQEAISDHPFLWLRYERPSTSSSLLYYRVPYKSQEQLTRDYLISLRDSLTLQYITTDVKGSYMVVNPEDLPVFFYETEVNGHYAVELRGIWEMENAFMGGPFLSFLIHDKDRNELVFIDGFVYGPGEDKRDLMQQLEHIIRTTKLSSP